MAEKISKAQEIKAANVAEAKEEADRIEKEAKAAKEEASRKAQEAKAEEFAG